MTNHEQNAGLPAVPVGAVMRETLGGMLDTMEAVDQVSGTVAASRARLIDGARQLSEAMAAEQAADGAMRLGTEPHWWDAATRVKRELTFDIAARLRLPERTAERLIAEAKRLIHTLHDTETGLAAGEFSYRHAQVIIDESYGMDDSVAVELEALLLPAARELTVSKFKEFARKLREKLDPEGMDARHRSAVDARTVTLDCDRDGMALLAAYLPAEVAVVAFDRLTRLALSMRQVMLPSPSAEALAEAAGEAGDDSVDDLGEKDTRTVAQLRADALGTLLIDGDTCEAGYPAMHGVRPQLIVSVPATTLAGADDAPGHLSGYGPIAPETARLLAARAPSFARVLTDPVTSAILDFDQTKYAVPSDLRTVLTLQFETCSFFGCKRPAGQCDMDHTIAYSTDGTTCLANLAPLCATHHRLKHHTAVRVRKRGDGSMQWFTATGRSVVTRPDNLLGEGMLKRGSPGGGVPPGDAGPERNRPTQLFGNEWERPSTVETFPF